MGRPPLQIDERQVFDLASIYCSDKEIALIVGCSVDTLHNRFSDIIEKGRASGRSKLRRLQWQAVEKGNVVMMIWLGKQILGQFDRAAIKVGELQEGDLVSNTIDSAKLELLKQITAEKLKMECSQNSATSLESSQPSSQQQSPGESSPLDSQASSETSSECG